ncbi:hypothetical protein GCM10009548_00160 [Streptomyces malaysiensis subsp. malaysiensis]
MKADAVRVDPAVSESGQVVQGQVADGVAFGDGHGPSIGVGVCRSGGSPDGRAREGDADDEGGPCGARNPGPGGVIDKAQQQDGAAGPE